MKKLMRLGGKLVAWAAFAVLWMMICVADSVPEEHLTAFIMILLGVLAVFAGGVALYGYGSRK